jgi:hypothetical protein
MVKEVKDMGLKYFHKKQKPNTRFGFCSTGDTPILLFFAELIISFIYYLFSKSSDLEQCKYINIFDFMYTY